MSFLYPFLTFLQPGMLWPELVDWRPSMIAAGLGLLAAMLMKSTYPRSEAFGSKGFVYLALFLLVQVLSLYTSGLGSMIEEFSFWFPYFLFVVISILLMPDVGSLSRYVWGMLIGGMVVVVYGIYAVPAWGGYEGTGRAGAYGMYDNHNDYSFIIVQILPFLYLFWRIDGSRIRRLLLLVSLAACGLGMAMSMSRGGMIALVVEAGLIVVIGMEGRKRLWILPALALVGALAISYQYAKRAENQGDRYTAADAEDSRFELWKSAGNMFIAHPVLGIGSRRFYEHAEEFYEISHSQKGKNTHNTFLEILAGSGLVGFLTFLLSGRNIVRELRPAVTKSIPPVLEAVRKAVLISTYSVCLRALLDAKIYDWCFYTLAALGVACYMLIRVHRRQTSDIAQPVALTENVAPPAIGFGEGQSAHAQ